MKITAIIPARGSSKRLKNKNIYPVWGKPMLYWSIDACRKSKYQIDVWVSSDSEEILQVAKELGVKTHKRSEENASDAAYKQAAIREAAAYINAIECKSDIYLSVQANSPTLTSKHLDKAIDLLIAHKKDEIFSVDENLMQNAAFRVFRGDYVFQRDLSTCCGVVVTDIFDVHTKEDVELLESSKR